MKKGAKEGIGQRAKITVAGRREKRAKKKHGTSLLRMKVAIREPGYSRKKGGVCFVEGGGGGGGVGGGADSGLHLRRVRKRQALSTAEGQVWPVAGGLIGWLPR